MRKQDYQSHVRVHPIYHYVLQLLLLGTLVTTIVYMVRSIIQEENILLSIILFLMMIIIVIIAVLLRLYPLKAQDRAIRAEENLRYYVLTGELLDPKLSFAQVVALRFASDKEFPELSKRAAEENLKPNEIKKAIQNWRADHNRI
ncbi:DUF6526 family protein [Neobacillus vireti]|uniref:ABC transporter permease n=1 Tax=Neobacillus vireti LMG 21834 TaxID=1131730 RepID=A0AB94II64_9BACI|nr:DUF6526 family protein [Neobacillus vireti]ETI66737.1 hypothetical protein BAVI_21223 [Neobacillus vireti LMG 21834]KLT15823.1 hypothetical protein AA980_21685 [Neobacillus vireti]